MFADTQSIIIKEYKGYLVLTKYNTPKIKITTHGSLLTFFNKKDVHISNDALKVLKSKLNNKNTDNIYALEIKNNSIYWASHEGIIIPPSQPVDITKIPVHTLIDDNTIDIEIKKAIDKHA